MSKQVPEKTITNECKYCAEDEPEWSPYAKCWIHRRATLDKRCTRKRLGPVGELAAEPQPTLPEQEQFRVEAEHRGAVVSYAEPAEPEGKVDMRNVIKWVGLPFRVAFFLVALVGIFLPSIVLIGFFSWEAGADLWPMAISLGKWSLFYTTPDSTKS